jgi:ubiquinol-cytochrome c reductase cytochrome b subunit
VGEVPDLQGGRERKTTDCVKALFDWLDTRTGYRGLMRTALYEHVPGGARWRYVWGSTLTFAIVVQFITGIFLWMNYSPGAQSAWESVYYIQEVLPGGWVLRGIHHFTAQLMVPLLLLHFMQVMADGAYRAPREVNYWFGLGLLGLTLAISLTGYLLPWDQRGYWSTKVVTNLISGVPIIGDDLQRIVVGDANYGHQTLTRFFAMHAGLLPALLVLLIAAHVALFRKHGLKAKEPKEKPDAMFWPDQLLQDFVACGAVILTVLGLVWYFHGAELGAPANPAEPYSAARPDWYFMALFQFLKFFEGERLIWGSLVIPGLVFLMLMFMPILGRWGPGHRFNLFVIFCGLGGYIWLTTMAYQKDAADQHYQAAVTQAKRDGERAKHLAHMRRGIPTEGALAILAEDPLTQGPRLFASQCASCHTYAGHDGLGAPLTEPPTAPDLAGFGSREWLQGFMDPQQIETLRYFGGTMFVHPKEGGRKSKMVRLITDKVPKYSAEEKAQLEKILLALSAEASLPMQKEIDTRDAALIEEGRKLFAADALECSDCHQFRNEAPGDGPDLTGYGSRAWLTEFLKNPGHDRFYGKRNDRMPAFGKTSRLSAHDLDLLVRWLRGESPN